MSDEHDPSPLIPDSIIDKLISDVQLSNTQQAQNVFTRRDIMSLTQQMGELVQFVARVVEYPSKFVINDYKHASEDSSLVAAINDPYVSLALRLQQSYATGQLELLDQLKEFVDTKRFSLKDDIVMKKFSEQCVYYLPELPMVRDEELENKALIDVEPSEELYSVGRSKFISAVNELLYIRFAEQDIMKDVMTYVSSKHAAAKWAVLYELWNEEEDEDAIGITPEECFFQYLGAVAMSNILQEHWEQFKSTISVLIEPIVTQFEEKGVASQTAKEELKAVMPGLWFDHIHTTTHEKDDHRRYMVHLYGGEGLLLIGVGVGSSAREAESRASAAAMYKKSHLDRAIKNVNDLHRETDGAATETEQNEVPVYRTYDYSDAPVPQMNNMGYSVPPSHTPPNPMGQPGMASAQPSNMTRAPPPGQLVNQDYQRQKEENQQSIALAPMAEDDSLVDKSSKQKLNEMLINMRYASAEYKTSKLSNSDVQVVCYIENIPIARAISTNKKKAGHVCAQYILGNWRYFFSFLPSR